jgi:hypothetical protein
MSAGVAQSNPTVLVGIASQFTGCASIRMRPGDQPAETKPPPIPTAKKAALYSMWTSAVTR